MVALGLHALMARPGPRPDERPAEREAAGRFASRGELDVWAAEHQVTHALGLPINVVEAATALVPRWIFSTRATLGAFAVVGDRAVASFGLQPSAAAELARVVRARLEGEAATSRPGWPSR